MKRARQKKNKNANYRKEQNNTNTHTGERVRRSKCVTNVQPSREIKLGICRARFSYGHPIPSARRPSLSMPSCSSSPAKMQWTLLLPKYVHGSACGLGFFCFFFFRGRLWVVSLFHLWCVSMTISCAKYYQPLWIDKFGE